MRTWVVWAGIFLGLAALTVRCDEPPAGGPPDSLALLKAHPEFAEITKITNLNADTAVVRISLCRSKRQAVNCEMFESRAAHSGQLADYVYLFAVYAGKYDKSVSAKSSKGPAHGLLQDAADHGYGQVLLNEYTGKFDCKQSKDTRGCILHQLFKSAQIQRYIVERSGHAVTLLEADEDGKGSVFEN